ncbi:MAG: ketopantoate reductase family protein, partial [Pauljensenia sp.]
MVGETHTGDVALIGAGAVGLSIASALARSGHGILVCGGSTPLDRITVHEGGAAASWTVSHTSNPDDLSGLNGAVLAVKAHQTASTSQWLGALAGSGVPVMVAQNGVEHRERVSGYLTAAQVIPAIVYLNAERTAPGTVTLRRVGASDLAVPDDEPGRRLARDLTRGGLRVLTVQDFTTAAWAKLLTNITANPLTALTGRRAEVLRDPEIS